MARKRDNTPEARSRRPLDGPEKIEAALSSAASNLWGAIRRAEDGEGFAVSVSLRGPRDWMAVVRSNTEERGPRVAFGNSETLAGAIVKLSASIASDRWYEDKFAAARKVREPQQLALMDDGVSMTQP